MDEEDQEEVMDYFSETEDDDFDQVLDEFGSVYSDEELRLLKIKFLSEMGI
jgi:ATP-dependent DNA helicase RecQ